MPWSIMKRMISISLEPANLDLLGALSNSYQDGLTRSHTLGVLLAQINPSFQRQKLGVQFLPPQNFVLCLGSDFLYEIRAHRTDRLGT